MTKIKRIISDRPYVVAGIIFLALAIIGVRFFGWWQNELELLLILYFIAIVGIRLDEISRKLGTISAAAKPDPSSATKVNKFPLYNSVNFSARSAASSTSLATSAESMDG